MKDISQVAIARVKEKNSTNTITGRSREVQDVDLEMSKVGLVTILAVGGVVGTLGLLFLLGGMMSAGNPLSFVSQWVQAVFGG